MTAPTGLRAGSIVTFRHPDPITGQILTGAAVVAKASTGGGNVALLPTSAYHLEVDPENVKAAKPADLLPEALREEQDEPAAETPPADPAS